MSKRTLVTMDEAVQTAESLSQAVSQVLGFPVKMNLTIEETRQVHLVACSEDLPLPSPMNFMFTQLQIGTFGGMWINDGTREAGDEGYVILASFELHFNYKHQISGYNGCPAGFCGQRINMVLREEYDLGTLRLVWRAIVR